VIHEVSLVLASARLLARAAPGERAALRSELLRRAKPLSQTSAALRRVLGIPLVSPDAGAVADIGTGH